MRYLKSMSLLLALALCLGIQPAGAKELKVGSLSNPNGAEAKATNYFAKRVGELTNGEITVKVFHGSILGKSVPIQIENTISGAQDFFIATMDYFHVWDKRFGALQIPFVFRDRGHFLRFLKSDLFNEMIENVEKQGIVFLGKPDYNWVRPFDRGVFAKKPIFTPDDLKGYKLRMWQSETPIKSWSALGANVTVLPWADVYTGLVTGVVNGLTGVVPTSYLMEQTEVVKYFTNLQEYFQIFAPLMGKPSWDKLTPAQQKQLTQAARDAGEVYSELSGEEAGVLTKKAQEEHGLSIILPPMGPWLAKMKTVHEEFESNGTIPKGIIAAIRAVP